MSRFGIMNNHNSQVNCRFGYRTFPQETLFQKQNHWETLRSNIDVVIKQSKLLKDNEHSSIAVEPIGAALTTSENSSCNEIEIIYECADNTEPVKLNPIAEGLLLADDVVSADNVVLSKVATTTQEETLPKKKRMDFASVVFKYRNELARRKHKELQSDTTS